MTELTQTAAGDELLGEILDELADRVRKGDEVDLSAYVREHPKQADQILRLVPTIQAIVAMDQSADPAVAQTDAPRGMAALGTSQQQLGDYRILREVGRGGMGVVYEAEQVSLRRRVALKVLPFAAVLDPRQVARFKNEALAAAQLHHTHIVEVFAVGCDRSVHFYAMRFIDGLTLGQVIGQLRQGSPELPTNSVGPIVTPSSGAEPNRNAAHGASGDRAATPTQVLGALSTDGSVTSREFFRSVAVLGSKVAQALDYAHQQGIVHRDIKPGNIMVDGAGEPWVTDFGLAHIESGVSLTLSGDVLGTLRYASPEQALGKRGVIGHRTDIYSLGITLYELLTQQAAFPGTDRQRLLQRIATEDPSPPREINPQIPVDLETIVLKATTKSPQERYETAQDLADDLQRFLDHEPIKARRPTLPQRISKWALRHTAWVWSAAAILLVSTIALAVSTALVLAAYQREGTAHEESQANLEQAQRNLELAKQQEQRADRERDAKEVQRQIAEEQALDARRTAYVADMRLAYQESNANAPVYAHNFLSAHIPQPGQADVRGIEWEILSSGVSEMYVPIGRHAGPVTDIDLFPDGRQFATSGEDGCVRIWDTRTRSLVREYRLQDKPIYTVGVSPDGKWLAYGAGSRDSPELKPVTIIDAVTGKFLGETNRHDTTIRQVRFSPDGRHLASGSLSEKLSIWKFTDGVQGRSVDLTQPYTDAENFVLRFLDDRRLIAEMPGQAGYRIWDVETGEILRDLVDADEEIVRNLTFNDAQNLLAYVPDRHKKKHSKLRQVVTFIDTQTGNEIGHVDAGDAITSLDFSPDGTHLLVGYSTGSARRIALKHTTNASGRVVQAGGRLTRLIHNGQVTCLRFLESNLVVTGGSDGTVTLHSPSGSLRRSARYPDRNPGTVTCLATSPDNRLLASAHVDGVVRVADHATGHVLAESTPLSAAADKLVWSGDGTHLAAITATPEFCCWRVESGSLHVCLRERLPESSNFNSGIALNHNGSTLYVGDGNAIAPDGLDGFHVWDVRSRRRVSLIPTLYEPRVMSVSPDDDLLVTAGEGIAVYDRRTHLLRHDLREGGRCFALRFAPGDQTLAAGYEDGSVRVWDAATSRLVSALNEFEVKTCQTKSLYFSPDGRTLIAGDNIGRLRFWNTATWGYIGSLQYTKSSPFAVTFIGLSPDGTILEVGRAPKGPATQLYGTPLRSLRTGDQQQLDGSDSAKCLDSRFSRRHVIDADCDGALIPTVSDIDQDGDLDLLCAAYDSNWIAWYENDGRQQFTRHMMSWTHGRPGEVLAADLDQDGDIDVVAAEERGRTIIFFENDGKQIFTPRTLSAIATSKALFARTAVADVDRDGDLDLVSASHVDNRFVWHENNGQQHFVEHAIRTIVQHPVSVTVTDLDGDGDLDVLSASRDDARIAWHENNGQQQFTPHAVGVAGNGASHVAAADIDRDGDLDVISASRGENRIAWYENDGLQDFTRHTISTDAQRAECVYAADLDGDGDVDVLSASHGDDKLAWYENNGQQVFTAHVISTDVADAYGVLAADLDGDGDLDLITATRSDDTIAWYENTGGHADLRAEQ